MRNNWNRNELMLAFNLYCKLPYGQFNNRNKEIIRLSQFIGRTPGAVAYKLVNFVSLDPKQKLLGRKGATNIGKLDKEVFWEFINNFDLMFLESEQLLENIENLHSQNQDLDKVINIDKKGEDKFRTTKVRSNQDYFRTIVLSNYANTCAVTGIGIPELLIASHIKPWAIDSNNRLNPTNGICLSATLDKAFDKGLITINNEYRIIFSDKLKSYSKNLIVIDEIVKYENKILKLPIKFLPNEDFIKYHNEVIFKH